MRILVGFCFCFVSLGCFLLLSGNVHEWSTLKLMLHVVEDGKHNSNRYLVYMIHEADAEVNVGAPPDI